MSADPLGGGHWEGQEEDQEHDLLTSAAADPFFGSRKRPGAELRGVAPAAKRQAAATPAAATTVGYPEWDLFAFAEWVSKFEYAAGINSSRVRLTKYVPHLRSRRLDRTGLRTPEAAVTGICTAILKRQAEALTSLPPGKSCMCEKELTAWSCSILSRRQGRRPDVPEDVGFERTSSRLRGRGRSPGHSCTGACAASSGCCEAERAEVSPVGHAWELQAASVLFFQEAILVALLGVCVMLSVDLSDRVCRPEFREMAKFEDGLDIAGVSGYTEGRGKRHWYGPSLLQWNEIQKGWKV
eukprot:symbB.v1.2.001155.t1/scaffold47.1/size388503/10